MSDKLKNFLKGAGSATGCLCRFLGPFYKAFVIQSLWNWFLASAIHSDEIAYWQAFGIAMLFFLFSNHVGDRVEEGKRTELMRAYIAAMVPPGTKDTIDSERKELEESVWYSQFGSFGDIGMSTLLLVVGFGIHIFLI